MLLLRAKLKSLTRDTRPNFREIIRLKTKGLTEEEKEKARFRSSTSSKSSSSVSSEKGKEKEKVKINKKVLKKKEITKTKTTKTKKGKEEEQNRQKIVKEKVKKQLLNSWPLNLFKFKSNTECKSSKRSASYFVSKSDLIDIIQKDAELSKIFPKNYKSKSKEKLCDILVPLEKEKEKEKEKSSDSGSESESEMDDESDKSSILSFSSKYSKSSSKSSKSSKYSKSSSKSSISSKSSKSSNSSTSSKSIQKSNKKDNHVPFTYFKNENNSCYIDSFFVSLMHYPNLKLMKTILDSPLIYNSGKLGVASKQIKEELQRLWDEVTSLSVNTCSRIRQLFQNFDDLRRDTKKGQKSTDKIDWIHDQQEPLDVINLLNEVFNIANTLDVIEQGNMRKISAFGGITVWPKEDGASLLVQLTKELKTTIVSAPSDLYIHVNRTRVNEKGVGVKNKIKLNFPFTLEKMSLRSVIVHQGSTLQGGHYVAHLKMEDDKWRTYDDTQNTLSVGRSYLSRADDDTIKKNCVALVYCNE